LGGSGAGEDKTGSGLDFSVTEVVLLKYAESKEVLDSLKSSFGDDGSGTGLSLYNH
jgi:hypothetical protein